MTAFYTNPVRGSAPTVYRSADRGLTWTDVGPKMPTGHGEPPTTNDPYLHLDVGQGRLFATDLYAAACSYLRWSDDAGASWERNPVACGVLGFQDRPSIGTAKPKEATTSGYANVLYYCVNRVADSACARSLDGGRTFEPFRTVFPGFNDLGTITVSTDGATVEARPAAPETKGYCAGGANYWATAQE